MCSIIQQELLLLLKLGSVDRGKLLQRSGGWCCRFTDVKLEVLQESPLYLLTLLSEYFKLNY